MFLFRERLRIINLSLADCKTQGIFKCAVQDRSQIDIFVHPFYMESLMSGIHENGLPEYRKQRGLMLGNRSKDDSPPIIFESVRDYGKLEGALKRLHVTGLVFAVMTPVCQPVPLDLEALQNKRLLDSLHRNLIRKLPPALEERCWDGLAKLLPGNQVSLGGQWLTFSEKEDFSKTDEKNGYDSVKEMLEKADTGSLTDKNGEKLQKLPGYCVGITALELAARNINVALSLPTWPNASGRILNYLLEKYFWQNLLDI